MLRSVSRTGVFSRNLAVHRVSTQVRFQRALFSSGGEEQHEFKAETRKLLDIVTNSIYTDKEGKCQSDIQQYVIIHL